MSMVDASEKGARLPCIVIYRMLCSAFLKGVGTMSEIKTSSVAMTSGKAAATASTGTQMAKTLGFFGFFAITASMVMTVYAYPNFASSGLHLIFFLIVAGIFWFLPIALISAEFATVQGKGFDKGGIFSWVGQTLGQRWGFAALFYQWFQITIGFVTMCFFVLACVAFLVGWDALYENPLVMFVGVTAIVWILTLTQLGGTKMTSRIAKVGFYGGVCLPAAVLLVGIIAYLATGGINNINMSQSMIPDFTQVDTLVIFASFVLAFAGVEASASHISEVKNANRTYPMVMIVLCIVTIALDCLGGLAVASAMPLEQLDANLSYGVVSAFASIFDAHFHAGWLVYMMAALLAVGVLAEISSWIVGPSKALLETADQGILPKSLAKTNEHGVSARMIFIQAIIVTIWAAVLCGTMALSGGSSSSVSYLTAIGLTVVVYLAGYVLFFLGYFNMVLKHKDWKRTFHVPGGTMGKCVIAAVGLFITVATLIISFFPPSALTAQAGAAYVAALLICWVISAIIPFVIYGLRHRWDGSRDAEKLAAADGSDHAGKATQHGTR